jgi:hypothetical protein
MTFQVVTTVDVLGYQQLHRADLVSTRIGGDWFQTPMKPFGVVPDEPKNQSMNEND